MIKMISLGFVLIVLLFCMLFSLSSCESREEKQLRIANQQVIEAEKASQRSQKEYEDLSRSISEIESLQDALG